MSIENSPEPAPEFQMVKKKWGALWPLHYNIFGILFALLFLYICFNILHLISKNRQLERFRVFLMTNILLLYFSFISSLSLLMDPYDSGEHAHIKYRGIFFLFTNLKFPCLTASLSLIELSVLEALKLQLYSRRLQNIFFLLGVISIHFIITFALTLFAIFNNNPKTYLTICQICYIVIGFIICISSIHVAFKISYTFGKRKIELEAYKKQSTVSMATDLSSLENGFTDDSKDKRESFVWFKLANKSLQDRNVRRIAIVMFVIAIIGLMYWITSIFAICSTNGLPINDPYKWKWFIVQTIYRLNEFAMATAMALIIRINHHNSNKLRRRSAPSIGVVANMSVHAKRIFRKAKTDIIA